MNATRRAAIQARIDRLAEFNLPAWANIWGEEFELTHPDYIAFADAAWSQIRICSTITGEFVATVYGADHGWTCTFKIDGAHRNTRGSDLMDTIDRGLDRIDAA